MSFEFIRPIEFFHAASVVFKRAFETFKQVVYEVMSFKLVFPVERLVAYEALKWFLASMDQAMHFEIVFCLETLGTYLTPMHHQSSMN